MSADNYLAVRRKGGKWVVNMGNASTGYESEWLMAGTRDEAIHKAQEVLCNEIVEYGLLEIEPDQQPEEQVDGEDR